MDMPMKIHMTGGQHLITLYTEEHKSALPRETVLKKLLKEQNITQEELANKLNLTSRTVREKLKGTCPWWLMECDVMCRMLDLDFEDLFYFAYVPAHDDLTNTILRSDFNNDPSK